MIPDTDADDECDETALEPTPFQAEEECFSEHDPDAERLRKHNTDAEFLRENDPDADLFRKHDHDADLFREHVRQPDQRDEREPATVDDFLRCCCTFKLATLFAD